MAGNGLLFMGVELDAVGIRLADLAPALPALNQVGLGLAVAVNHEGASKVFIGEALTGIAGGKLIDRLDRAEIDEKLAQVTRKIKALGHDVRPSIVALVDVRGLNSEPPGTWPAALSG